MRAARAAPTARVFSLARPIKFLIGDSVVAVPVINAKAPQGPQDERGEKIYPFFTGHLF